MGVNRCYSFMKCLLIILSIIFLCVGCGVLGLSVWALWEGGDLSAGGGGGGAARTGLTAIVGWSGALALGAALALTGAVRQSAALLAAGGALLALAAVGEAGAAVACVQHAPALRRAAHQELATLVRHHHSLSPARTQLLNALQRHLQCCGADSARDYLQLPAAEDALDLSVGAPPAYYTVPDSCCLQLGAECESSRRIPAATSVPAGGMIHSAGCSGRVLSALWQAARPAIAAAAGLMAAHAAALLLTLALALRAPQQRYKA